jgi:ribosomal protein S18 acetylase RimI-like enzyme
VTGTRTGVTPRARLRPATPADADFLLDLYTSTRAAELAALPLGPVQKAAFVRQQYEAQDAHWRARFPDAERSIVTIGAASVGRLYVDRSAVEVRLVDIALVPEVRGRGLGRSLLTDLVGQAAAAGLPVRLSVVSGNPARRLYARLGFRSTGWTGPYEAMELLP